MLTDHVTEIYSANEYWIITSTFSKARRHESKKPVGDLAPFKNVLLPTSIEI